MLIEMKSGGDPFEEIVDHGLTVGMSGVYHSPVTRSAIIYS